MKMKMEKGVLDVGLKRYRKASPTLKTFFFFAFLRKIIEPLEIFTNMKILLVKC